jgi:hypothetical protein
MMKIGSAELQIGTESRCIEGASVGAMVFCGMFFFDLEHFKLRVLSFRFRIL